MTGTNALASAALVLHALAAVVWVGGMFFAHQVLRPAAAALDPRPRLLLWSRGLGRFFACVIAPILLVLAAGPGCAQPAIGTRPKVQGTLTLFLEHDLVIDEAAFAAAPFRRLVLVDAGPDRIDGRHFGAVRLLDGEKHLSAVGIKSVP